MKDTVIELVSWMQEVPASNTGKKYYMLGRVKDDDNTLAVTEKSKDSNGGTQFYCVKHKFVYSINHGVCEECQKQVVTADPEASVTTCNTPEI
jgi:hypothetical protein